MPCNCSSSNCRVLSDESAYQIHATLTQRTKWGRGLPSPRYTLTSPLILTRSGISNDPVPHLRTRLSAAPSLRTKWRCQEKRRKTHSGPKQQSNELIAFDRGHARSRPMNIFTSDGALFLFKKIASQFLLPLPLSVLLLMLGLIFLWFSQRQNLGKLLVTLGTIALTLCSYGIVANTMLTPLEARFPIYEGPSGSEDLVNPIRYVVVLGGGHISDPRLPLTSQASNDTLKRLIDGIQIQRTIPNSRLVLSGGGWTQPSPNARVMTGIAESLGVRKEDIVLEDESRDTRDEALLIKPLVGTNRFILVTSASHMPRSMALFRHEGMDPIAAPVDHLVKRGGVHPADFFPQPEHLYKAHRTVYEWMGWFWSKWRNEL